MKQYFLFATVLLLCSCSKRTDHLVKSTKIVVIQDLTDSFALQPQPEPILAIFDLAHNKDMEAELDLAFITDRQLNPVQSIHLKDAASSEVDNKEDDATYRTKLIQKFYSKARGVFTEGPQRFKTTDPVDHSEVFCTIISQLRKLKATHFQKKLLIVFGDLNENSSNFSAYSEDNRKLLRNNPKEVAAKLSERCEVPKSLEDITIVFCFQPKNRQEDQLYLAMAQVYQLALEKRGARILFQASSDKIMLDDE